MDDYIKVFKKDKKGLRGIFKVIGQIGLGIIVGSTLYFHPEVTIKEQLPWYKPNNLNPPTDLPTAMPTRALKPLFRSSRTTNSTTPTSPIGWAMLGNLTAVVYILAVIFIVTAVSNGANLTDGLDGLATGTPAIAMTALLVLAHVSGSIIFASYLNIMYIPNTGELVIFAAAFIGAAIGFLWYNSRSGLHGRHWIPAIGAIIAVLPSC